MVMYTNIRWSFDMMTNLASQDTLCHDYPSVVPYTRVLGRRALTFLSSILELWHRIR